MLFLLAFGHQVHLTSWLVQQTTFIQLHLIDLAAVLYTNFLSQICSAGHHSMISIKTLSVQHKKSQNFPNSLISSTAFYTRGFKAILHCELNSTQKIIKNIMPQIFNASNPQLFSLFFCVFFGPFKAFCNQSTSRYKTRSQAQSHFHFSPGMFDKNVHQCTISSSMLHASPYYQHINKTGQLSLE